MLLVDCSIVRVRPYVRDRLAEFVAELNMDQVPARLRLGTAILRVLNKVGCILVEGTHIWFVLHHHLHDAHDARDLAFLPAASVEECQIPELHVFHVFTGSGVAHSVPNTDRQEG